MTSLFGAINFEQPTYKVVRSLGGACELREYAPQVRAQVRSAAKPSKPMGSDLAQFFALANFIFGKNTTRAGAGGSMRIGELAAATSPNETSLRAMPAPPEPWAFHIPVTATGWVAILWLLCECPVATHEDRLAAR